MTGRPLRFIGFTLASWIAGRVAMLWPTIESLPDLIRAVIPPAAAATAFYTAVPPKPLVLLAQTPIAAARPVVVPALPSPPPVEATEERPLPSSEPLQPPPLRLLSIVAIDRPSRFAASIWAIARAGIDQTRPGSQLGGSQAGVRITYALTRSRRLALSARLSTPLRGRVREAAIGVDWQPTAAPVHLLAEQRFATGRGRGGPAVLVVGGLDPHPLSGNLSVEAYAQAGAIARDRIEPFADGAIRLTHSVVAVGGTKLDLGIGGWGGAQRGATRLDIGPTAAVRLPIAGRTIRLTLDWRQRIAGNARPGSGPALTIGSDF